ncbi:MAG: MmcQ/YjbR family DNA-binding protein [Alphaproteobacteria bacterium]|nr:MmcQ/YjbR family DNA-binding protein [Alphaproteobacteria bacterium]
MITREILLNYVMEKYNTVPEKPWAISPKNIVLRRNDSKKWYGIIMEISADKLGFNNKNKIDILNVKAEPQFIDFLLSYGEKVYPAYHMNKKNWISIILDGSIDDEKIYNLIDSSYNMVSKKIKASV